MDTDVDMSDDSDDEVLAMPSDPIDALLATFPLE